MWTSILHMKPNSALSTLVGWTCWPLAISSGDARLELRGGMLASICNICHSVNLLTTAYPLYLSRNEHCEPVPLKVRRVRLEGDTAACGGCTPEGCACLHAGLALELVELKANCCRKALYRHFYELGPDRHFYELGPDMHFYEQQNVCNSIKATFSLLLLKMVPWTQYNVGNVFELNRKATEHSSMSYTKL